MANESSLKKQDKITGLFNSEIMDNRYAANLHAVFFLICLLVFALEELGLYSQTVQYQMRIGTALMLLITAVIQIIGRVTTFAASEYTKYIIIVLTTLETMVFVSILNFLGLLVLCLPILVAINYHSSLLSGVAIGGSALSALLFPVLGLKYHLWAVDYFYFLIWCVTGEYRDKFPVNIGNMNTFAAATVFIGTIFGFQILAIAYSLHASNKRKKNDYNKQIELIINSRDSILDGMASVVENRDNNTGGHIKRTSRVVELMVENLLIDDSFRDYIIRCAPLHDLGKIAIPDNILNKPGRLTDDEFEYIKIHPGKGESIIGTVFSGLNDENFMRIAKNIALYHHEKYDGSGYPKGISGEEIPLEARIMAIADVYDALVSKRCYKEPMSQEEAYKIIMDSMGSHFDPGLADCFEKAYPYIIQFYKQE